MAVPGKLTLRSDARLGKTNLEVTFWQAASILDSLRKAISKKAVLSVFVLVALWNISVSRLLTTALEGEGGLLETLREVRDLNLHIQLRFYQLLIRGRPIRLAPENVRLVYIDDTTHWTHLHGDLPTSRKFLAALVTNASQTPNRAAAIGLDIELLAPLGYGEGSDAQTRQADNKELLNAIQNATRQGVPVILASVFYVDSTGRDVLIP